jgi:hypothetical protein
VPYQSSATVLADNHYAFATSDVFDLPGIPGLGNPNPRADFPQHVVVKINGVFYDPSYGKTYNSILQWQDASVWGYYIESDPVPAQLLPGQWKIRTERPGVLEVRTIPPS